MTNTLTMTRSEAAALRTNVRTQLGRKTATEIRDWAGCDATRGYALTIADRLAASGFLTLSDVTDDEFDQILA